jgi:hypothetical protein
MGDSWITPPVKNAFDGALPHTPLFEKPENRNSELRK